MCKIDNDQNQSTANQSPQLESNFGDSSGPLFSIYYKAAKEEDNKMAERWQKDADGILFFVSPRLANRIDYAQLETGTIQTGLFSAAVAALLAVTVQDLRPNSQDISAFYLGSIYQVLADPNVTRTSISSPLRKPPPFSPPRYTVWVNSLWFLSLVMSVSCALWATSLHQWARRYIRLTQPERCSPEKRARMRAFFANGVEKLHIPWAVEGLPTLLHLSLFLFFGGLAIFLFNVHQKVFICVVLWIGLFSVVYGLITLLPLIRHDSPYYTPLSLPVWFPYAGMRYVTLKVLTSITYRYGSNETWRRYSHLKERYRGWMLGGMENTAQKTASKRSSKMDIGLLDWTISALGDDDSLEKFFEAIPGFLNSKLVDDLRDDLPYDILRKLSNAMNGLLCRTLSSNSAIGSVKQHRLHISMSAISLRIPRFPSILGKAFFDHWNEAPPTVEVGRTLERWCTSNDRRTAQYARGMVSMVLATVQERDDRWVELAARVYGLPECDIRDIVTHGDDSVALAIFIHLTRKDFRRSDFFWDDLWPFTQFDICNTLSRLQHDFCAHWNEIVQEAKKQGPDTTPVAILYFVRNQYIALHQGTDAAPTAFSLSTKLDSILWKPSSYPLCNIASHRRDSIARVRASLLTQPAHSPDVLPSHSTSGGTCITVSPQVQQASIIARSLSSSHPTIPSEIGDNSQVTTVTSPALSVHTSPRPTNVSSSVAVASALKNIAPAATLSHPLEGAMQRNIVALCSVSKNLSTASTPAHKSTLAPVPESSRVLNKPLESRDAGFTSTFNSLLPASSVVGVSIPVSPPPFHVSPLRNADSLVLLNSIIPSCPTGNATLPRLRALGLVNTGNMCFANAVLQLLLHSPPFWNLFRELGDLMGQREAGDWELGGGGGVPLLVGATMRFFEEFVFKEGPPPTQQPPHSTGRKSSEGEEEKIENKVVDSFEPTYLYGVMKEKRRLETFLVRSVRRSVLVSLT